MSINHEAALNPSAPHSQKLDWFCPSSRAQIKQQEKAREAAAAESKKEQSVKAEGSGAQR